MKKLFWKLKTIGLLKSRLQNQMKKIIIIKKKIGSLPKRKNQRKWWGGSELKLRGKNSKKSNELVRNCGGWGSSYFRRAENLERRMEKDACWGGWKGMNKSSSSLLSWRTSPLIHVKLKLPFQLWLKNIVNQKKQKKKSIAEPINFVHCPFSICYTPLIPLNSPNNINYSMWKNSQEGKDKHAPW